MIARRPCIGLGSATNPYATTTFEANNAFLDVSGPEGGFRFARALQIVADDGTRTWLEQRDATFMDEYSVERSTTDTNFTGQPKYYSIFSQDSFSLAPVPDAIYTVELHYLYKPTSLVSDTSGTWLSVNARDALLYASLIEGHTFMKGEPDLLANYENRFSQEISRIKERAEARGRRDEYRYDSLRSQVS